MIGPRRAPPPLAFTDRKTGVRGRNICRMDGPTHNSISATLRLLGIAAIAILIAACQSLPAAGPATRAPLQMIRSGELTLPDACEASGSVVVAYTVYADGQTGNIDVPAAPKCLQQALTQWVASFRYSPQITQVPATMEWLLVEAKKGS